MANIEAVIFDLDGLIIDSEPLQWKAMNIALEPLGIRITEAEWIEMVGRKTIENLSRLKKKYGFEGSLAEIEATKNETYRAIIRQELKPMPGLPHAINVCRMAQLRLGVASSSVRTDIEVILESLKILDMFDAIVSGDQVPEGKPHPAIFLRAAQLLGIEPIHCLVLEDTVYGVVAAKAAGMFCIAIPNRFTSNQDLSQADLVLESLAQLDLNALPSTPSERSQPSA